MLVNALYENDKKINLLRQCFLVLSMPICFFFFLLAAKLGITSRNIPFVEEKISGTCVCCGKEAEHLVYWGRAY
jgi:hypothetical protein